MESEKRIRLPEKNLDCDLNPVGSKLERKFQLVSRDSWACCRTDMADGVLSTQPE
jgi:hypothetical protein